MERAHRIGLAVAALGVVAAAVAVLGGGEGPRRSEPPIAGGAVPAAAPAAAALDRAEVEALWSEIRALQLELAMLRSQPRATEVTAERETAAPATAAREAGAEGELSPEEALALYVRSFLGGGQGIEYYRLIVEAHAPRLSAEIIAHASTSRSLPLLRERLIGILGDARLRGNPRVLGALGVITTEPGDEALPLAAARSLTRVTGEREADWLCGRWAAPTIASVRVVLIDHLLTIVGEDPNPCLARLIGGAPDEAARALAVARLSPAFVESALPAYHTVRALEQPTRLAGAERVHDFRSADFIGFVQAWRDSEPDEAVRRALGAALASLAKVPPYHPEQTVGPADVANLSSDDPKAWAPALADAGAEWLEVDFPAPVHARAVRVVETSVSGAIQEIVLVLDDGTRETGWKGERSRPRPGVFEVEVRPSRAVRSVRIVLDTSRAPGWNEIDAVELVGPGGGAWATRARASSWYGQTSSRRRESSTMAILETWQSSF